LETYKESPDRISTILSKLKSHSNFILELNDKDFGIEPIERMHSIEYMNYLKNAYQHWIQSGGSVDGVIPDTFPVGSFNNSSKMAKNNPNNHGRYCFDGTGVITEHTFQAAYDAVQVCLKAVEQLEMYNHVFALCRPPGHHSHFDLCGGYCFFNNAAIAVNELILKHHRVAILDIDYHHGNGTQQMFYHQENPLYISIHGSPDFPFYFGYEDEKGEDEGLGFNVNIPLKLGTADEEYLLNLNHVIDNHIQPFNPTAVVVSLGIDTYEHDPIGNFKLSKECYKEIGRIIGRLGLKTLFVMEGGYFIDDLGENVASVLLNALV
jgi:acetoin utilization deacetylase AcuC-like enzyme